MKTGRPLRFLDYVLAMMPVWLLLNASHAEGVINLSRYAQGVARILGPGLTVAFPVYLVGGTSWASPHLLETVLACIFFGLLRWRARHWSVRIAVLGSLVWLVMGVLGRIAQDLGFFWVVSSRGDSPEFLFGFDDVFMVIIGDLMIPLILAAVGVSVVSGLWTRLRGSGDPSPSVE